MSGWTRRVNRVLGRTFGVQIVPGRTRSVRVTPDWFVRLVYFSDLLRRVRGVPGDVAECGVADGTSLAMLTSILRATDDLDGRRVWGFDAWEGLPPASEADLSHERSIAAAGMFGHTSVRRVGEELTAYGWTDAAAGDAITLVPGYFEDTLPSFDRPLAFLHVDADLYESYRCVLTNLWPHVQPGGVVAFDEYEETEKWPGAKKAVDEFLGSLPAAEASLREDARTGKWWVLKAGDTRDG